MTTTYQVEGYDSDGCTLVSREAYTLKAAREEMRLILTDQEYIGADLRRVKVLNDLTGECVLDKSFSR